MKWVASPSTIRLNRFSYTYRLLLLIFVSVIVISVPVVMYGVYIGETQRSDSPQGMIWIAGGEFDIVAVFRHRAEEVRRVMVVVAPAITCAPPIRRAAGAAFHAEAQIDFIIVVIAAEP